MAITADSRLTGDDGFVTIPAAMQLLEVGRSRLLALVIRGDLRAKQMAGQLFIERASLDRLANAARQGPDSSSAPDDRETP